MFDHDHLERLEALVIRLEGIALMAQIDDLNAAAARIVSAAAALETALAGASGPDLQPTIDGLNAAAATAEAAVSPPAPAEPAA